MKKTLLIPVLLLMAGNCIAQQQMSNDPAARVLDLKIINSWYCPDAVSVFPPIDIKDWQKTPAINGRLPTFQETEDGKSMLYINKSVNPSLKNAKAYPMHMPRLAYEVNPETHKKEIVVVVQMVQFSDYVWVGFRYLTGGAGSSKLKDCKFLSESEIKKVAG